jgi:hypothetical protein
MAYVTQELGPGLFFSKGLAADVPCDVGVRPHGGAGDEVVEAMAPQFEPLSMKYRYLYSGTDGTGHRDILLSPEAGNTLLNGAGKRLKVLLGVLGEVTGPAHALHPPMACWRTRWACGCAS